MISCVMICPLCFHFKQSEPGNKFRLTKHCAKILILKKYPKMESNMSRVTSLNQYEELTFQVMIFKGILSGSDNHF